LNKLLFTKGQFKMLWSNSFSWPLFLTVCILLMPTTSFGFDNEVASKIYKKCATCHMIGPNALRRVGPQLNGLEGRKLGIDENYQYSKAIRKAGAQGIVWNFDTLDQFLKQPKSFLKGTRMSFAGLKNDSERHNLINWLLRFDVDGNELSDKLNVKEEPSELMGAAAAKLEGDPEYGEYLSGECATCHKINGVDEGIPSIIGWRKEQFIDALYQYKKEIRDNPVMRTVAKRLGDEEMAALAVYYSSAQQK